MEVWVCCGVLEWGGQLRAPAVKQQHGRRRCTAGGVQVPFYACLRREEHAPMPNLLVPAADLAAVPQLTVSNPTQSSTYVGFEAPFAIDGDLSTFSATTMTAPNTNWFSVQVPAGSRCVRVRCVGPEPPHAPQSFSTKPLHMLRSDQRRGGRSVGGAAAHA